MRKIALALLFVLSLPVVALAANVQWDQNPVTDNVLYYNLKLDGVLLAQVLPVLDTSCNCVQYPLPSLANGSHVIAVSATNQWGTSADTTLSFNVGGPGTVKNVRIR